MEYLKNILKYFFAKYPGQNFGFYTEFIIFIAILIVGAIAFSIIYQKRKKYDFAFKRLFRKTASRLTLFALFFVLLIAVRYENIPYFAMRIFLYLAIVWFLYFVYKTVRAFQVDYPREKENAKINKPVATGPEKKYLPNKK